jgi:hypothetical protein
MEFITDIQIIRGRNQGAPAGYVKNPLDLNKGAGGEYIYLCYKKESFGDTNKYGDVITDIVVTSGSLASKIVDDLFDSEYQDRGYTKVGVDLNIGAGGAYLYLLYRKEIYGLTCNSGVTDIVFITGKDAAVPPGYTKVNVDLNKGAGGDYIYLCYKTASLTATPVLREWMKYIRDDISIADMSIPGTHDSAMWADNMNTGASALSWSLTQFLSLTDQFDAGIRHFDLRVYLNSVDSEIGMCHTTDFSVTNMGAYSKLSLPQAFEQLVNKLREHPSEFIIVWVAVEEDITKSAIVEAYKTKVKSLLEHYRDYIYIDKGEQNMNRDDASLLPMLREIRGKIFLISDAVGKKYFVQEGNCHLEGGYKKDPWRLRYKSAGVAIDLGNEDDSEKGRAKVISGGSTFKGVQSRINDGASFERYLTAIGNQSASEVKLSRCYAHEAWDPRKANPREAAVKNNPQIVQYLQGHLLASGAGLGCFDFAGRQESLRLAWEYIKTNPDIRSKLEILTVPDGTYKIASFDNRLIADIEGQSSEERADAIIFSDHDGSNQKFIFQRLPPGYYKICAVHSGKALDVCGADFADRARIIQYTYHGGDNQHWYLFPAGKDGYVRLVAAHSGKCIDVTGGIFADRTKLQQYHDNGTDSQIFKLVPVKAK